MMKKQFITLIALAFILGNANSQSIERSVIGSAGGTVAAGGTEVSWNTGEVVVNTASVGSVMLTQGFEQPVIPTTGIKSMNLNAFIRVFPNPTTGLLTLSISNPIKPGKYYAEIRDITGKLILSKTNLDLSSGSASLDLSNSSEGCYFLQLTAENQMTTAFKITLIK